MRDGGTNDVYMRVVAELSKVTEAKDKFAVLRTEVKALDYDFRQGKITADQLKQSLAVVTTEADKLNLKFKQTTDLNAQIYQVQQRASVGFKSLAVSVNETTQSVESMHNTLRQKTNPALTSVTQIISDAPYGIRGMGNNIDFLAQQFAQLSSQGFKTREILSGMISGLAGPTGLLLAISSVTALATVFGDKLFGGVEKSNEAIKSNIKLLHELGRLSDDEYIKTLEREQSKLSKQYGESSQAGMFGTLANVASAYGGLALGGSATQFIANRVTAGMSAPDAAIMTKYLTIEKEIQDIRNKEAKDYEKANKPEKEKKVKDESLKIEKELWDIEKLRYEAGVTTQAQYMSFLNAQMNIESVERRRLELQIEYNKQLSSYHVDRLGNLVPTLGLEGATDQFVAEQSKKYLKGKVRGLSTESQSAVDAATQSAAASIKDSAHEGFTVFESVGVSAIKNVSNLIDDGIGGALEQAFGRAESAWGRFVQNMAFDLASEFAKYGLGMLLTELIPGGWVLNTALKGLGISNSIASIPQLGSSTVSSVSLSKSGNSNSDVIRAINNLRIVQSTSAQKMVVEIQGASRIRNRNVYGSTK